MPNRSTLLAPTFVLLLVTVFLAPHATAAEETGVRLPQVRKILLISIDTLRQDSVGPYNPSVDTTPNLTRLARQSWVFEDAIAQAPSTALSHKSLFYSVYPAIHRTTATAVPTETLVSPLRALQASGFRTAGFVGGGKVSAKLGFGRGFDTYEQVPELDELVERSNAWLAQNWDRSFLLFLHTYQVHCPYTPPEPYRSKHTAWYEGDVDLNGKLGNGQAGCGVSYYNRRKMAPQDYRYLRALYAADVEYVDASIERVLAKLRELGIDEQTLVIFTSDHGESFGEHGFVGHNRLYNIVLRVPLIIKVPGAQPKRVREPVELIDLMPTVFALARIQPPYRFQGRSLLEAPPEQDTARIRISEGKAVAVQNIEWKLVFRPPNGTGATLVNLRSDPEETHNVISQHPEMASGLRRHYERMLLDNQDLAARFTFEQGNQAEVDAELLEELRALGYVE